MTWATKFHRFMLVYVARANQLSATPDCPQLHCSQSPVDFEVSKHKRFVAFARHPLEQRPLIPDLTTIPNNRSFFLLEIVVGDVGNVGDESLLSTTTHMGRATSLLTATNPCGVSPDPTEHSSILMLLLLLLLLMLTYPCAYVAA